MSQKYHDNTKRPKPQGTQLRDLKNLCILLKNSTEGLGFRRNHCWGYIPVYGNTLEKLLYLPQKSCCKSKGTVGA